MFEKIRPVAFFVKWKRGSVEMVSLPARTGTTNHKPHTLHTTHAQNPRRNEVNNAHYTTPAGNTGEYRKYWKDMRCHRDFPAFN